MIRDDLDTSRQVWRFEYSTDHDPRDHMVLEGDVRVIWSDLKQDPRLFQVNRVNVTPVGSRSFWVWEGWRAVRISQLSTTFVYERRDSGAWCERHGFNNSPPEDDCRVLKESVVHARDARGTITVEGVSGQEVP